MVFFRRVGNILRQTVSPSVFQLIRCMSNTNKVFVGGLAQRTNKTSLQKAFGAFGEVSNARVILDRKTGRSQGFGYVSFADPESASAAIKKDDLMKLHGRTLSVCYANNRIQRDNLYNRYRTVFVGGLAQATNDTTLREAFSPYGRITEGLLDLNTGLWKRNVSTTTDPCHMSCPHWLIARVIMDRATGRSRGFGIVTFAYFECVGDAIDGMDQWELHGRTVTVRDANCYLGRRIGI